MTNPLAINEDASEKKDEATPQYRPAREPAWQRKTAYPEDPRFKSPALATFLSLVPGLGQVYVGYYRQGFINILVVGSLITLVAAGDKTDHAVMPLLIFFLIFYWLYNLVDAARRASFYNQALSGIPVAELPQEFRMPERHGSLLGGALMILGGIILASNTVFGFSLQWLERWWPVALILVGIYLVYQAWLEQKNKSKSQTVI
ncbi:MAG: hypothetical protein H6Q05_867 [Acidobacteria bacterium]|nr:hypothetical protein [Acidobacteriota bacterium]